MTFSGFIIQRKTKSEQLQQKKISQDIDLKWKIIQLPTFYFENAHALTAGQITKIDKLLGFKNHQTLKKRMENLGLD